MVFLISAFVMAWTVTTSPAPEPNEAQDLPTRVFLGINCGAGAQPFDVALPPDVEIAECAPGSIEGAAGREARHPARRFRRDDPHKVGAPNSLSVPSAAVRPRPWRGCRSPARKRSSA